MNRYEYIDEHGYELSVVTCHPNAGGRHVGIEIYHPHDSDWKLLVKAVDAPAVALAILEAVMTDDSSHADPVALQNARAWLRTHVEEAQ